MLTYFPDKGGSWQVFNGDGDAQRHAWNWAETTLGEGNGDSFVAWLLEQDCFEQDHVWYNGYATVRSRYAEARAERQRRERQNQPPQT
jgi:hypothetical protein